MQTARQRAQLQFRQRHQRQVLALVVVQQVEAQRRQAEAEQQRQAEAEQQRQAEAEQQRQAEAEHQRRAEVRQQRQARLDEEQREKEVRMARRAEAQQQAAQAEEMAVQHIVVRDEEIARRAEAIAHYQKAHKRLVKDLRRRQREEQAAREPGVEVARRVQAAWEAEARRQAQAEEMARHGVVRRQAQASVDAGGAPSMVDDVPAASATDRLNQLLRDGLVGPALFAEVTRRLAAAPPGPGPRAFAAQVPDAAPTAQAIPCRYAVLAELYNCRPRQ